MAPLPSQQAAKQAAAWQNLSDQLARSPNLNDRDLQTILQPLGASGSAFSRLVKQWTHSAETRRWLVGRAYLQAAASYFAAARYAITERRLDEAKGHCLSAVQCLTRAVNWLPSWEQESVRRWAVQGQKCAAKLPSDPFYAFTHLTALVEKVTAHALFVLPQQRR